MLAKLALLVLAVFASHRHTSYILYETNMNYGKEDGFHFKLFFSLRLPLLLKYASSQASVDMEKLLILHFCETMLFIGV